MHATESGLTAVAAGRHKIPQSVLVVIHDEDGRVLLLERSDAPGFWQSVTGSRDRLDEPLEEVSIREVAEETGIVVGSAAVPRSALRDWRIENVYAIHAAWRRRYAEGVTHNTEHVFGLLVPRSTAVTLSPREHLRHEWLAADVAAKCCSSSTNAEAIRRLPAFSAPSRN